MSMYPNSSNVPLEYAPSRELTMMKFFNQVYAWMFAGLAVTGIVGYFVSGYRPLYQVLAHPGVIVAAFLGLWMLSLAAQRAAIKVSAGLGLALFMLYAAVLGVLISVIFLVYKIEMLAAAFVVTAGVFGAMSLVGFVLKKDLSGIGGIAVMLAIGLFFASLVNVLLASDALSWVITYGVLIVFVVITAYRTQELKNFAARYQDQPEMLSRVAVAGSLILYISFMNLFMSILRIMGNRK
jgi:FtsH-binding integral membrane protein